MKKYKTIDLKRKIRAFLTSVKKEKVILKAILLLFLCDILIRIYQIIDKKIGWNQIKDQIENMWKFMTMSADFTTFLAIIGIVFGVYGWMQTRKTTQILTKIQDATINLEDATRRNLHGFSEIFARALWLLEHSEQRIIYVNFLFGFGKPHRYNRKVIKEYTTLAKALNLKESDYEEAVNLFFNVFLEKVLLIPHLDAVVLKEDSLKDNFLNRLKQRKDSKKIVVKDELKHEKLLYKKIYHQVQLRDKNIRDDFQIYLQDRIPFQMLIAQINKGHKQSDLKWGCLVFLVGTENIETNSQDQETNSQDQNIQEPQGFYTEIDDVVTIYKNVAESLKKLSTPFDWTTWEARSKEDNTHAMNSVDQEK